MDEEAVMRGALRIIRVMLIVIVAGMLLGQASLALTRDERRAIMKSSVLILPLKIENGDVVNVPWSGSGTIIDKNGLILTNYHVVQETGDWDVLGILVTSRSDQKPEPTFLAKIASKNPEADLAVLQIVSDFQGKPVDFKTLNLVPVPLGDADDLELGDQITIFGYPGIGSGTITLTDGKIAGFLQDQGFTYQRAWLKTDASIAGGNSGGTAVDETGKLIGVPTRASTVDVRRIADTNEDGIIDERDSAVPTGGFINLLRPVNLAFDLIKQAQGGAVTPRDTIPGTNPTPSSGSSVPSSAKFGSIRFASQADEKGNPLDTGTSFGADATALYAYVDFQGMKNGLELHYIWSIDDTVVFEKTTAWPYGAKGSFYLYLTNGGDPMPAGTYQLEVLIAGKSMVKGSAIIGSSSPGKTPAQATGVTLYGVIYNAYNDKAIAGAQIVILKPGVTVASFLKSQKQTMIASYGETDAEGYFSLSPALERGKTYAVIIVADGYKALAQDKALTITNDMPDSLELEAIGLYPE